MFRIPFTLLFFPIRFRKFKASPRGKGIEKHVRKDNLSSQNVTNVTNVTANFEGYIYGPKDEPRIIILQILLLIGSRRFCCNVRNVRNALVGFYLPYPKKKFPLPDKHNAHDGMLNHFSSTNKECKSDHRKIYQQRKGLCAQYRILLTIGIPRNVNKKSNGEIICAGRKGGVSLQCC